MTQERYSLATWNADYQITFERIVVRKGVPCCVQQLLLCVLELRIADGPLKFLQSLHSILGSHRNVISHLP